MNSKDFQKVIVNSAGAPGETMEIHYEDGTFVKGFVQRVSFDSNPPYVNFCKSVVPRGQSSDHTVDFERIVKVVVHPYGKDPVEYE